MSTPLELLKKVKRAWSSVDAAPSDDMESMEWAWGKEAAEAFTGIKPVDVDIESSGFQTATPLFDIPGNAAAAYLGTYLISLLDGLDIQEKAGFPTDIMTRAHTLIVMTDPHFWTAMVGPNLPRGCQEVVGEVADLLISKRNELKLEDADVARLQRLIRSINRALKK